MTRLMMTLCALLALPAVGLAQYGYGSYGQAYPADASRTAYDPAVDGDWSSVPAYVSTALDTLAAAASGAPVPDASGAANGDLLTADGAGDYAWVAPAFLVAADNLSDLGDAGAARTNLALGTAAVEDTGAAVGDVVALEDVGGGTAGLPAVDGSQLTGLSGETNTLAVEPAATGADPTGTKSAAELRVKGLLGGDGITAAVSGSDVRFDITTVTLATATTGALNSGATASESINVALPAGVTKALITGVTVERTAGTSTSVTVAAHSTAARSDTHPAYLFGSEFSGVDVSGGALRGPLLDISGTKWTLAVPYFNATPTNSVHLVVTEGSANDGTFSIIIEVLPL